MKRLSMRRYIAFIIILASSWAARAAEPGTSPTFKMSGDVSLMSHYVEHGLSQSNKAPALQGSFWFNFGSQFRLGLWGSNTDYENSGDNFNLRANADIKVSFSNTTHLVISYARSQYYNNGDHNGDLLGARLEMNNYRILYENNSNWEATNQRSTRYGFGMQSTVFGDWKWNNEVGYNTPNVDSISPYFDARTGLGFKWSVIFLEGALTGTSQSSQFNGAGDFFFILSASTDL